MIIQMVTGCICDSLTVDGLEEIDMTEERRKEVIIQICNWVKKNEKYSEKILESLYGYFYENDDSFLGFKYDQDSMSFCIPEEDEGKVVKALDKFLKENYKDLNIILQALVGEFSRLISVSEPCDCCGDSVYTEEIDLDNPIYIKRC